VPLLVAAESENIAEDALKLIGRARTCCRRWTEEQRLPSASLVHEHAERYRSRRTAIFSPI
jgi:hypothetical protein